MLIKREYIYDDSKVFVVINPETAEVIPFTSQEYPDYDSIVQEISQSIDDGTTYEDIYEKYIKPLNFSTQDLLAKYGITVNTHGITVDKEYIDSTEDMVLPKELGDVFKNIKNEEQLKRFALFTQLLAKNPYSHSKESLIQWIIKNPSLEILEDGRIRGFRGVTKDLLSIHSGYGIVNGVEYNDQLDNTPGNIIEFPAEMIDHNPRNLCSVGIHVGTADYAFGFGYRFLKVAFSPQDVVSFPADSEQEKIRVSKVEILEEITNPRQFLIDINKENQ